MPSIVKTSMEEKSNAIWIIKIQIKIIFESYFDSRDFRLKGLLDKQA